MMEKRAPSPRLMEKMSLHDHQPTFDKIANHVRELHSGDVSKKAKSPEDRFPKMEPPKAYQPHTFGMFNKGRK